MKVADMHCDTVSRLYFNRKFSLRDAPFHINEKKLLAGGYVLQNFAIFMARRGVPLFQMCQEMLDLFDREVLECADGLAIARSFADIQKNLAEGKISAVLTVEDGAAVEGRLERLSYLYDRGVRMLTLTWNFRNELAAPNQNDAGDVDCRQEGLTALGIQALEEMERLGIIADVSHLSDAGFWDVCRRAKRPFAASHSSARALCGHCRNLTDDMLRALADRGGIAGINFYGPFLGEEPPSLAAAAKHVRYMVQAAGENCVALGSDFDGIEDTGAFIDAGHMQRFPEALRQAGLTERQIEKVNYGN